MKLDFTKILAMMPLIAAAVDEVEDVFGPEGFKKKEILEAVDKAVDAAQILLPQFRELPRASVRKLIGGLFETYEGVRELQAFFVPPPRPMP